MILVVEDDEWAIGHYRAELKKRQYEALVATTLSMAFTLFKEKRNEIEATILTYCLSDIKNNTMSFLRKMIDGKFSGIIVAASGNDRLDRWMWNQGCTHTSPKIKAVECAATALILF